MNRNRFGCLIALFLVAGCSSNINSSWTCPTPTVEGQACLSISGADARANSKDKQNASEKTIQSAPVLKVLSKQVAPLNLSEMQLEQNPQLHRTEEKVARVWFAPFIDRFNNRHEDSIVYFVDSNSTWRQ